MRSSGFGTALRGVSKDYNDARVPKPIENKSLAGRAPVKFQHASTAMKLVNTIPTTTENEALLPRKASPWRGLVVRAAAVSLALGLTTT